MTKELKEMFLHWKQLDRFHYDPIFCNAIVTLESHIVNYSQETERLKAELSEKDAEIERLEQEKIMLERYCSKYESELSELKERHKKDVMEAFGDGWEKGIAIPKLMCVNLEQYYKQKFEK